MGIRELEDYDWFPPLFRRFQVEIIGEIASRINVYKVLVPDLESLLERTGNHMITDLCS